jgi:hypothetical protein
LTQNKVDEAEQIIRKIKKFNKEEIPGNLRPQLESIAKDISQEGSSGIRGLFATMRMATITLLFSITL